MKKHKKIAAVMLAALMLTGTAFAEADTLTYKAKIENGEISVEEKDLIGVIDNSNLDVNVIKQQGDTRTTVFTGKLKDYDNGRWVKLDFSEIQFALIFDWDTMENEAICITPISLNTINSAANTTDIEKDISTYGSNNETELSSDIKIMYNNEYYEGAFITNGSLDTEISIGNSGTAKSLICYLAEYDQNGKLVDLTSNSTISVPSGGNITAHLTKTFSNPNTAYAKIFLWEQNSIKPITKCISLQSQQTDYYADSFVQAKKYDISKVINGRINSGSDVDYISFTPTNSGKYVISANSDVNVTGGLYDEQNKLISSGISDNGGYYIVANLSANNTYYLQTSGNIVGDYRIKITKMINDSLVEITNDSIKLTQAYNSTSPAVIKLHSSGNLLQSITANKNNGKINAVFDVDSLQQGYTITVSSDDTVMAVYQIKTIVDSNTYNVTDKSYVSVPVTVSNVANFDNIYFSVAFDENEFNIADVCEHTYTVSETGIGLISNAEVNIQAIEDDAVIFTSTKALTGVWNGNVNTVKLQAIGNGECTVNTIVYSVK